jgi:hypothetical protein
VAGQVPQQPLARRLRALREEHWPGKKITQPLLAQALGVSVPLISSWESQTNPRIPPSARVDAYATLFATARSADQDELHLLSPQDLDDEEQQARTELRRELTQLRNAALRATGGPGESAPASEIEESLSSGPWRFDDGNTITVVCAQWPPHMLERIPYTDVSDPDYIELLTYSELDALFELHGHLRAANPANQANLRSPSSLASDDYTTHLVTLGGIDWNRATTSVLERLPLPVRQVADWETEGGQYFEVTENGKTVRHRPVLEESSGQAVLREDVALFARAVNPFNRRRTVTICSGMYGRGTYGAVRALTDAKFRDRNAEFLRSRFMDSPLYCVLTRVQIVNGATLTPDWTTAEPLFEWSR